MAIDSTAMKLHEAVWNLAKSEQDLKERLTDTIRSFFVPLKSEDFPIEISGKFADLMDKCLRNGPVGKTISEMEDRDVLWCIETILSLELNCITIAERHRIEGTLHSPIKLNELKEKRTNK